MKSINIVTSHNITIQYELASIGQRLISSAIDLGIYLSYCMLIWSVFGQIELLAYTFTILGAFYHYLFEVFNGGQSLGKVATKIKVVTLRGTTPTAFDLFLRWIFRLVDVTFSFASLAILTIFSSERSQRIGDILANTTVVQLNNGTKFMLEDIRASLSNDYSIAFPQVTRYTDKEMLAVKDLIQRMKSAPDNSALQQIAKQLESKMLDQMDILKQELPTISFLEKTLQDYIVLTR